MRNKKYLSLLVGLLILSLMFTACTGAKDKEGDKPADKEKPAQHITYNNGAEPETIDPAKASGAPDLTVINAVFEGLVRYDLDAKIQPAAAEKWEIKDDGKTYVFTLRDAKWSNGDPVTAEDFVFAWERLLKPETAADYAYQLYYVENAEAYNTGEIKDFGQVGIKAVDGKTLEVKLNAPTPQFLGLTSFGALMPVNKKTVSENPEWSGKADTYIGNGPFKLTEWIKNQKFDFVKNDQYWDKDAVKLDKLTFTSVSSASTELNMFETDQIDFGDNPPLEEMERLIKEKVVTVDDDLTTYYYIFNTKEKPLDDVKVRKALAISINREMLVKNVTKAGQKPAYAFVPPGFPDADNTKDFRAVGGDYFKEDVEEAKKLLAEAGFPDGKGIPKLEILTNDSESHIKIASAIIEMWKQNLGIELTVTPMEFGTYLKTRDAGDFQISRAGWGADYLDAMTFIDMWVTNGGNNDTGWGSPEYDKAIKEANATTDTAKRFELMHKAEKLAMDEMIIMPIYFYTNPYMVKPFVKDYKVPTFGPSVEFKWAFVEK